MKYKTSFTHGNATIYLKELQCEIIQLPRDYIKVVSDNNGTRTIRIGCSFPVSKGIFRTLKQFLARSLPNLRYLELGFLEVKDSTIAEPNATKILHLNVALASIDLIRFDIHLEKQTYILIRTNTDNRTRYFFSPNKSMSGMNWKTASHRCVWGTLGQTTHEEVTELSHKMVSLEFNSVKTIYINNMVAA